MYDGFSYSKNVTKKQQFILKIDEYLRPLSRNEYTIKDTQQFYDLIK